GCKPHDCATERLVLAYDEKSHAMWGVFARARRDRSDLDDGGADESRDELTWLGRPDAKIKAALKQWLYQSA
ncbi:Ivy family c-type lysozyme inhibitor, partial [Dyella sp.]